MVHTPLDTLCVKLYRTHHWLLQTRFTATFSTQSWDEVPLTLPPTTTSTITGPDAPTKVTHVTTQRVFSAATETVGTGSSAPTFTGTALASYHLLYAPTPPDTPAHEHKATYTGVMSFAGTLDDGQGLKRDGSFVVAVVGKYGDGLATGEWSLVKDSVKGAFDFVGEGKGGYEAGAKDSSAWLEVEFSK